MNPLDLAILNAQLAHVVKLVVDGVLAAAFIGWCWMVVPLWMSRNGR